MLQALDEVNSIQSIMVRRDESHSWTLESAGAVKTKKIQSSGCCIHKSCRLYLSHRDKGQLAVLHCVVHITSISLNFLAWRVSREQDEEDWSAG